MIRLAMLWVAGSALTSTAQEHVHHHGPQPQAAAVERIFLDKTPRIIWFQLNRLSNERLLMVERSPDDPKYAPVYLAILTRPGLSQHRGEALQALIQMRQSDGVTELLAVLSGSDANVPLEKSVAHELAALMLQQPKSLLAERAAALQEATRGGSPMQRAAGYAGLLLAGQSEPAWLLASSTAAGRVDYLTAVGLLPDAALRETLRARVVESLDAALPADVRRAAIAALAFLPARAEENFQLLAPLVADPALRDAAVSTLLRLPADRCDATTAQTLVSLLVEHAESTPAEQRTSGDFVDAMQLADQLIARLPEAMRRSYRQRLEETVVRVVRIRTVQEEMRYDTPYFAVQAGRPVQVVLQNADLMPHNLVITAPGALQEVALQGALLPAGTHGKEYVPDLPEVLWATHMVPAGRQEALTFTAPSEPGEYPYVCTFPRHWMRMYGVMVVVEDLDEWLKSPRPPADPTGNNRSFIRSWVVDDLQDQLADGLRGRSPEIGARIFQEATCAQCHKMHGHGGAVGPELTDVLTRWKGDRLGILREILDPAYKVEPQFAMQTIVLNDGRVLSGIVKAEDQQTIALIVNPEVPDPTVIRRADIDEIVKSSKSMMPKALLDRFTQDEIFELLSYLVTPPSAAP